MRPRKLIKGLLLCTVMAIMLHFGFCLIFPPVGNYHSFFTICLLIFLGFTYGILHLALRAAESENLFLFNNLILITVIMKLFIGVILVVGYSKAQQPADRYFAIPFFVVYVIFTVFETIALSNLGKKKK